jgi:hypothetical protein
MQKRKPSIILAVSSITILGAGGIILAFAGGPPTGATGSAIFGQASCAQASCHLGTANSGTGSLTLSGVPANYTLGQMYTLTVTLQQNNQRRWGFQLSARARLNGQPVGTLQQGNDGFSQMQSLGGIQYVAHNAGGTRAGTVNGPVSFQVRWTAPSSDVGEVVFSVAGNAANNDNNSTGDFIYTNELTSVPPSSQAGPPTPTSSAIILPFVIDTAQFRCNLIMSNLTGTEASVTAQLVDAGGNVIASKQYAVPANGLSQINRVISDILGVPSPTGNQGYLILESSQKITAASTPVDNITTDSAVIQGTRGVATRLLSPTSTSVGAFKTTMTIVNDSLNPNNIEIKLKEGNGNVTATKSVTIAPYGYFHTEDMHAELGVSGTFGPIELTSKSPVPMPFLAVSRVYATITASAPNPGTGQTSSFFTAVPFD